MTLQQENGRPPEEKGPPEDSTQNAAQKEKSDRYSNTTCRTKSLGEAAIDYGVMGWLVFLLGERGKLPRIPSDPEKAARQGWDQPGHGHLDATTDLTQISRWWRKCPRGNIGMPTGPASGFFVVDIDGVDAAKRFDAMGDIGRPMIQKSARGWHLFYSWTDDCRGIRNSASVVGEKIDIRAEGGYVALAPSEHPSGHVYRWQNWDVEPSPPPSWLIDKLRPKTPPRPIRSAAFTPSGFITARAKKALETMARRIETAPFGQQEKTLSAGAYLAHRLAAEGKADALYAERAIVNAGLLMPSQPGKRPWRSTDIERKVSRVMGRAVA